MANEKYTFFGVSKFYNRVDNAVQAFLQPIPGVSFLNI